MGGASTVHTEIVGVNFDPLGGMGLTKLSFLKRRAL